MSRPYRPRSQRSSGPFVRINGKIRAREVRVVDADGSQVGILAIGDALTLARLRGVDLVEVAPNAQPPVCRVVDYGKYRYEQAKKEKESKKNQHVSLLKEIQLSARIDSHDLGVKVGHAIDFLCEDMKLKVSLRFRGREMAHTEVGFQVVEKFLERITDYGQPDFQPRLNGRTIVLMVSPLPKHKRAKHPDAVNKAKEPGKPDAPKPSPEPRAAAVSTPAASAKVGSTDEPFSAIESTGT